MNKKPELTAQTKHNLEEAFWTLFEKKPLEKISIKEITDLAGYNRGTFYLYYQDIYELLEKAEDEMIEKIGQMLQEHLAIEKGLDLNGLIRGVMELVQPYSKPATILLGDNGDPKFATKLKELLRPLLSTAVYAEQAITPYQQELLEEFWLSGILGIIRNWIGAPQIPLEELITFLVPYIFPH